MSRSFCPVRLPAGAVEVVRDPTGKLDTGTRFFRSCNKIFDWVTRIYGKTVSWCLRLSVIVLLVYHRSDRPDGLRLLADSARVHPVAGQGSVGSHSAVAGLGFAGTHRRGDE